ncbi:hypothetical protein TRFO_01796 [Tritrichomonas foetus]|uniref:EF-hand domain-containing protein n=1 Tax=Tritrichomonas foetus TaxID=1144522 RepID=A0A1J4JHX6_9EUKA|nr:hypothetical protein TRFO_01796 [Tritrichomonas foetus]|eukprot:OHS98762.1 hypothetical protein TRFO_01796 [Tritrichomonas foetus]
MSVRTTKRLTKKKIDESLPKAKTVLSFTGKIVSNNTDDNLREFMVNFCVEDSTFAVYEKVIPNSGFPGGKYLKETKATCPDTGKPYSADDVYVGSVIVVNGWRFKLVDASEGTLRIIEQKADIFQKSSMKTILNPISKKANGKKGNKSEIEASFKEFDPRDHGKVTREQLQKVLQKNNISMGEQEFIILFRKYQFAGADRFLYKDFLADI